MYFSYVEINTGFDVTAVKKVDLTKSGRGNDVLIFFNDLTTVVVS